jgi:hypothetical protein
MMAAGLFLLMTGAPPPAQAASCLALVSIPHLRCDFKPEEGGGASLCVDFLDQANNLFFMHFRASSNALICKCAPLGSFKAPKFNAGREFLCTEFFTDFQAASGKVVGNKIKKGLFLSGSSMQVFECAPNPTLCP